MIVKIERALISVSDKRGLATLAKNLVKHGVEIISTGGTGEYLKKEGIPYLDIIEITDNPECFDGRMKTISFQIESGILFDRASKKHVEEARELGILPIDLVVCNLYPFENAAFNNSSETELISKIDVGGPTMVRAAAKNFNSVSVLVAPDQYESFSESFVNNGGGITRTERFKLSLAAFRHTQRYDSIICAAFERINMEENELFLTPVVSKENARTLRYGENPHQKAWSVAHPLVKGLPDAIPLQGKELSYNNLMDANSSLKLNYDLQKGLTKQGPVVTIIKHGGPCGAALDNSQINALKMAWAGDPVSSFGSIICFSDTMDGESAQYLSNKFVEVILAPSFSVDALTILSKKKNLRLIETCNFSKEDNNLVIKKVFGGYIMQTEDMVTNENYELVSELPFISISSNWRELADFGVITTKFLLSNAIGIFKQSENGLSLIGAGAGNPNRIISLEQACVKAISNGHKDLQDVILISDAFFPFSDNIELAAKYGIKYIIQPGGSIKDQEVIETCNKHGIAMLFSNVRHFLH